MSPDSTHQVVFVLQLLLTLGPLAVYFLGLGLLNSQAHPSLVRAKQDFLLLSLAFLPVIVVPMVSGLSRGWFIAPLTLLACIAILFLFLLRSTHRAWVIYNIDEVRVEVLLKRACRRLGWTLSPAETAGWHLSPADLVITKSSLPWLRNVTLRFAPRSGDESSRARLELFDALRTELSRESMLPSATGASLVLIGAGLIGLPMCYVCQHMEAIVDVVRSILLA
jgi:hypothetical protein